MLKLDRDTVGDSLDKLQRAIGVIPVNGVYQTSYYAQQADALPWAANGTVIGARAVKNDSGVVRLFAGSTARIEEYTSTGIVNRSRVGGYGAGIAIPDRWWFSQGIGANEVIATNEVDAMQVSTGGAFSDLANAPKARIVVSHSNALLAMNYTGAPNGIKTTNRGDATNWTAGTASDAAALTLVETPGAIVAGAVLNDVVVAWKRSSMYVGRFVGGDEKWQFNLLSPNIGCFGREAWVTTPLGIIFAGPSGVFLFDGSMPRQIDAGIRQVLFSRAASVNSWGAFAQMSHDDVHGCVFLWMLTPPAGGNFNCYAYNYKEGRWSRAYPMNGGQTSTDFGVDGLSNLQSVVRDLNFLDYASIATTTGTGLGHFVFAGDKKIYNLNGTDLSITGCKTNSRIKTGRFRLPQMPNADMTLRRVYPIFAQGGLNANELPTKTMDCFVTTFPVEHYATNTSGSTTTQATWDATAKRFDVFATGKHFEITIVTYDADMVGLKDIRVDMVPVGAT